MDGLKALISLITLKDIIDMGIVAVLLYQVIMIMKGTRAVQMFIGVLALAILFWIGVSFKLYSLNWILAHFFDSFFIILVILFQDEIRSALANFWAGGGLFNKNKKDFFSEIEEIIQVCTRLSEEKIGGLIVFERVNGLSNYIETGTQIFGEIHSDLIYSLFFPKSPLHDGAIIISKNEITAAGCFLPLSQNNDVDRQFGTRHRAALGISEVSDCVVVTVSEESGNIGVCVDGKYIICAQPKILRERLRYLLQHSKSPKQTLAELEGF